MNRYLRYGLLMVVMLVLVACGGRFGLGGATPTPDNMTLFEEPNGLFTLRYPKGFNEPTDIGDLIGEQTYVITSPDKAGAIVIGLGLGGSSPSDDVWTQSVSRQDLVQTIGSRLLLEQWEEYSRDIDSENRTVRLEVGSAEAGMHGTMWLEESDGALAVIVWAAPDEQSDQFQPQIEETLDSFEWSAERARDVLGDGE